MGGLHPQKEEKGGTFILGGKGGVLGFGFSLVILACPEGGFLPLDLDKKGSGR